MPATAAAESFAETGRALLADDPRQDAEAVCAGLEDTMDALIMIVEQETALVRSGDLGAAGAVERQKADYARRYLEWLDVFQAVGPTLRELAPGAVERIRRQHEVFRSTLQISLAVLATARESLELPVAAE
jgi:hypothetical protein